MYIMIRDIIKAIYVNEKSEQLIFGMGTILYEHLGKNGYGG